MSTFSVRLLIVTPLLGIISAISILKPSQLNQLKPSSVLTIKIAICSQRSLRGLLLSCSMSLKPNFLMQNHSYLIDILKRLVNCLNTKLKIWKMGGSAMTTETADTAIVQTLKVKHIKTATESQQECPAMHMKYAMLIMVALLLQHGHSTKHVRN